MEGQLFFNFDNLKLDNDIIVSDFNKIAYNLLQNPDTWLSNIVYIYGEMGVGKSLLSNNFIKNNHGLILNFKDIITPNFSNHIYNQYNYFLLENLVNLNNNEEEQLFHLYNFVNNNNKKLIITSQLPVTELNIKLPDLLSRLNASITVEILLPDENSLKAIFIKLLSQRQFRINKNIMEYIFIRIPRSPQSIINLINALDNYIMIEKKTLTIPILKNILIENNIL